MIGRKIPDRGDVYWIDPNPVIGRETKDRHRYVVISPKAINRFGVAITVAITGGGGGPRESGGLTVPISGHDTHGVAVCTQVRSFDIHAHEDKNGARYVETLDKATTDEIALRVASVIEPSNVGSTAGGGGKRP